VCRDGAFAVGLDQFTLELVTEDGDPPTAGELFGVDFEYPFVPDELQYSGISLTLSNPFQADLSPSTFPVLGEIGVEVGGATLVSASVVVLDLGAGSVYVDVDGDLEFDAGEPVALVRAGSVLIDTSLPYGGDWDPDQHLVPFEGSVRLTLEPIFSVSEPSQPNIRAIITSVDPDTGGPNDGQGVFPRITLRDFTLDVGLAIDVKPGSVENPINPGSKGVIPVAVLSEGSFDAGASLDPASASFGPDAAPAAHGHGHREDVDGDGDRDLVLHFPTRQTGIQCGDTQVTLTIESYAGEAFQSSDSIRTVGCKQSKKKR